MNEPMENTPPSNNAVQPAAEERTWGMLAHLSSLLGALISGPVGGWGCFIGPLVVWLVKKDTMPFVNDQGKEALNFNITVAIISLALLVFVVITFGLGLLVAAPLWGILGVYWLVCIIIATVKANDGHVYRYPLTIRFLK